MKLFKVAVITLLFCCLVSTLYFFLLHEYDSKSSTVSKSKVVIYAAPTFHEEVTSSVACILHSLGFYVIVYISNGYTIGPVIVPFTGLRKKKSVDFYGRCVSEWITIQTNMKIYTDIKLLVFITYPMLKSINTIDHYAVDYLKELHSRKSMTSVVYIVHRTDEMMHPMMLSNQQYIPINRSFYVTLSDHTYKAAQSELSRSYNTSESNIRLSRFYPVLPRTFFHFHNVRSDINSSIPFAATFVMQGRFGGRHAHRKNPGMLADCLRRIESSVPLCSKAVNISMIKTRRLSCRQNPGISLDIIGHQLAPLDLGTLRSGRIRTIKDLWYRDYYHAIARGKFMILGLAEQGYFTTRATSSVPTAMIAQVPLVATREFLSLYPCLNRSYIHSRIIAQETECQSVTAALSLSSSEYALAKAEVEQCSTVHWEDAQHMFLSIINGKL